MGKINQDTIVASLTVGQFKEIISSLLAPGVDDKEVHSSKNFVYGLSGIQDLFQCSHTQAQRYKDGVLRPAVIQSGRKIMVDVDKAIELFNNQGTQVLPSTGQPLTNGR